MSNSLTVDASEEFTYLTKTAYAEGLLYLQENFLTKKAFESTAVNSYKENLATALISSFKRVTIEITPSTGNLAYVKDATYDLYLAGYQVLCVQSAYMPYGTVSYKLDGNTLTYSCYYGGSTATYMQITFEILYAKISKTAEDDEDEIPESFEWNNKWYLYNGALYPDVETGSLNARILPVGDKSITCLGSSIVMPYSVDARVLDSDKLESYYENGYIAALEIKSGTLLYPSYVSVTWKPKSSVNITHRYLEVRDGYTNEYEAYLKSQCKSTDDLQERTLTFDTSLKSLDGIVIYGNGIEITNISVEPA